MTIAFIKPGDLSQNQYNTTFQWNLQYIDKENKIFTLQTIYLPSNIFAPTFKPNTGVVGTPLQSTGLQACETDTPGFYTHSAQSNPYIDIVFQSGPIQGDQDLFDYLKVILDELKATLPNQKWKFLLKERE
ncbi:hypothetical protein Clacol_004422 [Clathrus columnatus]|uniref:Uncharacterized protein n=1 Tax=Clathrus columnatus TaxID=1419009 RepID=A0AAV5AAZ6_9AGAM|nr:hypothetical protein Clacol_004422 [Clathrus columnatus]